ncbi:hypothetical protein SLEP1_g48577 [Rubroshorea leprosula]|uniref:Disease resistance protein At4g27190-like leucine-rich repeats domain-containing protein n=1 Tax=Rubroshorea leprosula TaxID=152421 RepID=A0AAV5LV76_9ROSI|nr:hypothetical protein SLEP1_g48577 [Rubroshorea leprosula]
MNQQVLEEQEGSRSSTTGMPAVSFVNLRTLEVSRCHGLVTILSYTIAKRFDQLSTMSITDCSKLEEIVACEGNEVKDEIVFTQLTSLRLGLLSRLESFCSWKCNRSFPSLHEVILSTCPEMSTFSKGVVKTEKLQKVKLTEEDDSGIWKDGDLNSSIQYLFTNKTKTLPHLDEFHGRNVQGVNAVIEDKKKDDGQEKEQNEDDGLDHNENKGENSVSLDDSHPSIAQYTRGSASKRNEVALSSKEKKREEDAVIVAQEPDSKKAEGESTAECIVNAARLLGNDLIKEVNKELIKGIGSDVMLLEKSSRLDSALSKIEGLTEDERNIALRKLPDHPIQMLIFFNLSPDRRLAWVRGFLMDH